MAFNVCISELLDEIQSAISWDRSAILLAINTSDTGRRKAQKKLEEKLTGICPIISVRVDSSLSSLFQNVPPGEEGERYAYFLEGLGTDVDNYRFLNLQRETFIEKKIVAVFWLTEKEAAELPRFAPDFWAFRHRVIQFAPERGPHQKTLPAGLFLWHSEFFQPDPSLVEEQIAYQQVMLQSLTMDSSALMLRVDTLDLLAHYHWYIGRSTDAIDLLQQAWELVEPLDIVDVKTKLLNGLAVASYTEDDREDTSSTLEKAIKLDGKNDHLWANVGLVQYLNGRTALAIRNIEKAIRIHSTSVRLHYILGYIHLCSGKYDKAQSCFEQAMELNDENFAACCGLAVCFIREALPDALDRISKLFLLREDKTGTYHSICVSALLDNRAAAMTMLQQALAEQRISLPFIRHDPTLHLILDEATLNSLER